MGDKNKKIEQKSELSIDQDTKVNFKKEDGNTVVEVFFYEDRDISNKKSERVLNVAAERIYLLGHHVDNLGTEVPSLADVKVKINSKDNTIEFSRKLTRDEKNSIEAALHNLTDNEIEDLQKSMNMRNGVKINQLEDQFIGKLNEIYGEVDYAKVSAAISKTGLRKDHSYRGYENQERTLNALIKELEENPNSMGQGLAGNAKKVFEAAIVAARQVEVGEVSPVKASPITVSEKEATLAKALTPEAIEAASKLVKTNVSTPAAETSTPAVAKTSDTAPAEKTFTEVLRDFTKGNSGIVRYGAGFSGNKDEIEKVKAIQAALVATGFPVKVDGKFGDQTELAVRNFTATYSKESGVVDRNVALELLKQVEKAVAASQIKGDIEVASEGSSNKGGYNISETTSKGK